MLNTLVTIIVGLKLQEQHRRGFFFLKKKKLDVNDGCATVELEGEEVY